MSAFRRIAVLLTAVVALSGCVTAAPPIPDFEAKAPLPAPDKARPILLVPFVSQIPKGRPLGVLQHGAPCDEVRKLVWQVDVGERVGSVKLVDSMKAVLGMNGYTVVGRRPLTPFEDTEEWRAELLLSGSITSAAFNACRYLGTPLTSGEAAVEVEWQIFERRTQRVILSARTGGTARVGRQVDGADSALISAYNASLLNLMADSRFQAAVAPRPRPVVREYPTLVVPVVSLDPNAAASSDMIEYGRDAVVTIRRIGGAGSGCIVSSTGLILTAAHVVGEDDNAALTIVLADGRSLKATILRRNEDLDIALIQLESGQYRAIPVGTSQTLRAGDPVFAIGTPMAQQFERTVTRGVVSAMRSDAQRRRIQSDVGLHPGSSGGPLLDDRGRVVGIAEAGVAVRGATIGLNFFVPIDDVWRGLQLTPEATPLVGLPSRRPDVVPADRK
jgi:S1-C subfamily serine protease